MFKPFRLRPRWRKVLRDLWLTKIRTLLVVLSIAVGVFAVGTIASSQIILSRDLRATYLATHPAHATILTIDSFDDDLVEAVEGIREVAKAEARGRISLRVKTGPDEWCTLWLIAVPDFDEVKIDQFWPEQGSWPPPEHEMLIERAALSLLKAEVGDVVLVKTPEGKERYMRIAGLAHDLNAQIYVFGGVAYGFATFDTLEWLGQARSYNELRIVVAEAEPLPDRAYVQQVANKVRDKIEDSGRSVFFTFIPEPGQPPLDFLIQAISIILGTLGVLSLLLSGFLVVNTLSALLTQQTRQIGIMKAVGGRRRQISGMYLVMVIIFGLLALLIAVPLGMLGAHTFTRYIASFLNFDINHFRLPPEVLAIQVAVGLLVPVLAALYPVIAGTRITVQEALSTYGLGKGRFGTRALDRLLVGPQQVTPKHSLSLRRYLSRPLLLSLRNTFRRRGRLALTLMTLILGGAIFIAVFSVRDSLMGTLDNWLNYFQFDVDVQFDRDYRVERIRRETLKIPGVVEVETWGFYNTRRERPDGSDSDNIMLMAPPAETRLIKPTIVAGRWLQPSDQKTVVINTIILRDEPDLQIGSEMVLKIEGREEPFQVVGVTTGGSMMPTIFISYPDFARAAHRIGQAEFAVITTEQHSFEFQQKVARAMEQHYERIGLGIEIVEMVAQERTEAEAIFEVIVVLLLIMAVLLAVIGGLGLMGTMSINVLERTREIGVMRAIGASNASVRQVFIIEGVIIGLLSWGAGALLAYPISKLLSDAVGRQFLSTPLDYTFSFSGVLIWLVVVICLSALASFLPAWNASRLTVREVLAYE
jgi:putative ABC transport system permease protein